MRFYLGLACSGHDNALALVDGSGEVVFAEATERALQIKRALHVPPDNVFRVRELVEAHCPPDAEIVLAKTWSHGAVEHLADLDRKAEEAMRRLPHQGFAASELRDLRYVLRTGMNHIAYAGLTAQIYLQEERGQRDVDIRAFDHHLTHAAAACLTGPFERATCLVVDGLGEHGSTRAFTFDSGRLETIEEERPRATWPGSLGFFFMEVCRLCGFDPAAGEEWKVMGLAAHGKRDARIHALMRSCVAVDGVSLIRPPGALQAGAALRELRRARDVPVMESADLAHTGQLVFSELVEELLHNLHERAISRDLVLGGGCALNSSFNGQALECSDFERLHVSCAPADDGNAVGAALLAWREDHPDEAWSPRSQSPYLGSRLSPEDLEALEESRALHVTRMRHEDTVPAAADRLASGQVIGWVQGRAEFGPRALGNRSILADPRRPGLRDRISATIKHREGFRPFAPAILHEHGPEWFEEYRASPYMERTLRFREEVREKVPAVVHVDGTGRLQSVTHDGNPRFQELLSAFHERSGVPLLLNTSLNVMGKPMVHSVDDALALFCTSGLDALFLEDCLVTKEE